MPGYRGWNSQPAWWAHDTPCRKMDPHPQLPRFMSRALWSRKATQQPSSMAMAGSVAPALATARRPRATGATQGPVTELLLLKTQRQRTPGCMFSSSWELVVAGSMATSSQGLQHQPAHHWPTERVTRSRAALMSLCTGQLLLGASATGRWGLNIQREARSRHPCPKEVGTG